MRLPLYRAVILLLFSGTITARTFSDTTVNSTALKPDFTTYEKLQLPALNNVALKTVIKVAVVDDGFRLSHRSLTGYWYKNTGEIPGNGTDDDGNGYIDDITGYDIADNDADVSVPDGRESFFYHGTMTAGTVVEVVERCYGNRAGEYLKIIPVKVMNNKSEKPYFEHGYEGIEYAVKQNPDIIICAWSGGNYNSEKYSRIFMEAQRKGIIIIASAGNFYSEKCDPPASIGSVYAIAAIDTALSKSVKSNYGEKVDLSAFGELVYAPYCAQDNTYSYYQGTSSAASQVAGCAAVLKLLNPALSVFEVMGALKNTATPLDTFNIYYAGKLGAGLPNLSAAYEYLKNNNNRSKFFNPQRPEGDIVIEASSANNSWNIAPSGDYKGFYFSVKGIWNNADAMLKFVGTDKKAVTYTAKNIPGKLFIAGNTVIVEYEGKKSKQPFMLSYEALPVDSTKLYCSDIRMINDNEGMITDGSGDAEYAGNSSCKWQLTVAEGERIKLMFDEFDTQAKTDLVYLFEGDASLQENLLGIFSGPDLPPVIVSGSNKVLVWFVTDKTNNAKGWQLLYKATDEEPGVFPPLKK